MALTYIKTGNYITPLRWRLKIVKLVINLQMSNTGLDTVVHSKKVLHISCSTGASDKHRLIESYSWKQSLKKILKWIHGKSFSLKPHRSSLLLKDASYGISSIMAEKEDHLHFIWGRLLCKPTIQIESNNASCKSFRRRFQKKVLKFYSFSHIMILNPVKCLITTFLFLVFRWYKYEVI